ncbi:MAG: ABC transporter ATP-binding protein [Pseudomonadota bacterium]
MSILHVENLNVTLNTIQGEFKAVSEFSLRVDSGEIHGIIGESGSGKSMMARAILGLLPHNASFSADYLSIDGINLLNLKPQKRREIICKKMSIIFQDSANSLDPCFTVGYQLDQTLKVHEKGSSIQRKNRAMELLQSVGFESPETLVNYYPHQLSHVIRQRISIATTIASRPLLLIADEPTSGLDPTSQSQINELLLRLNVRNNMSILLITHDFAILSQRSDSMTVMYCGEIMETGYSYDLLSHPRHPYTRALMDSVPSHQHNDMHRKPLFALKGVVPPLHYLPIGCTLGPRCPQANKTCVKKPGLTRDDNQPVRCHFPLNDKELS